MIGTRSSGLGALSATLRIGSCVKFPPCSTKKCFRPASDASGQMRVKSMRAVPELGVVAADLVHVLDVPHHEAAGRALEPVVGRLLRVRDPVEIHLQLDQRGVRFLEDDVVAHLPVLVHELEVVIVIRQLQAGLLDLRSGDVQPLGDDLELVDGPEALGEQRPGDVGLPQHLGALDAPIDVALQVVDAGGRELVEIVMTAGRGDLVRAQAARRTSLAGSP